MYPMTGSIDDADVDGGRHDSVTDVASTLSTVRWRGDEGACCRPSLDSIGTAVRSTPATHRYITTSLTMLIDSIDFTTTRRVLDHVSTYHELAKGIFAS